MNMRQQRFWTEMFDKEVQAKLKWYRKYFSQICQEEETSKQSGKTKELLEELQCARRDRYRNETRNLRKTFQTFPVFQYDERCILHPMKPVDPQTAYLLYTGLSCEDNGRKLYLKLRADLHPDERYYFPEATSWDYGWRNKELAVVAKSKFARSNYGTECMWRKYGVFNPPENEYTNSPVAL